VRVVHISTYDAAGGAARAAYRLHQGLERLGHRSSMLVAQRSSSDPAVVALTQPASLAGTLSRYLRRARIMLDFERYRASRPSGYELFSDDRSQYGGALVDLLPPCDLINLHWVAGFVDYQRFFGRLLGSIPVVWTLHDMNPFTGGCHYDDGCSRYRDECGACPQLGSTSEGDLARRVWRRKGRILAQIGRRQLHVVAPSRWLASEARRSTLLGSFPVSVIPYGLDIHTFTPRDPLLARNALEIPRDALVVLFVAQSARSRRKGFSLLADAVSDLSGIPNLLLVSLGNTPPAVAVPAPHKHLGAIQSDCLLSLVYSAADLFVIPSLEDNLPNTVLESLACGTPVVGFDVGGIPDMVRPGVTGLLAPPRDVAGLRSALLELLRDTALRAEMSENCRRIAVEEYALEVQATRYGQLYGAALSE
jgi:glycosyltransferase involved in cell wall biosynthesis